MTDRTIARALRNKRRLEATGVPIRKARRIRRWKHWVNLLARRWTLLARRHGGIGV